MNKFKVGDWVTCITDGVDGIYDGKICEVTGAVKCLIRVDGKKELYDEDYFASVNDMRSSNMTTGQAMKMESIKTDQINNPSHYQIMPGVEVIHVRRALLDKIPAGANLNAVDEWSRAWEYITRGWSKNGLEDFKKAQVYLGWLIERLENETKK